MQFDEEKVDQEELEEETVEELQGEEDREIEEVSSGGSAPTIVVRKPRATGLWLTAFAAIVIILIGGLASYYYYTFQSQGAASEQQVRDSWKGTVDVTQDLVDSFNRVSKWEDLKDRSGSSFSVEIDAASRTVRDTGFDLQNQPGLTVQGSTVASKFAAFAEDYGDYIAEMRRVVDRIDEIKATDDLSALQTKSDAAEKAYDDLLSVNKGFLKASLPRVVFDIADKMTDLAKTALGEEEASDSGDKQDGKKAEEVVNRFAQAWQDKDGEAMTALMTVGGKSEFNEAILEDSSDVLDFGITSTVVATDNSKITIKGQLKKKTPDDHEVTENWQFVLLPSGGMWLIDSFKQ